MERHSALGNHMVQLFRDEIDGARDTLAEAAALCRAQGNPDRLASCYNLLGEIAPELVDNMVDVARFETGVFDSRVTDLERRRYFEMV